MHPANSQNSTSYFERSKGGGVVFSRCYQSKETFQDQLFLYSEYFMSDETVWILRVITEVISIDLEIDIDRVSTNQNYW